MQANDITQSDFWESRYQQGTPRWDLGRPAPTFVRLLDSDRAPAPGKAIVLGCGRGYDALLFADRGFEVTGVDFADSAIASATTAARERGANARFLQHDIFELSADLFGQFDYAIEHTCFCALPPEQRSDYVRLVQTLLKPGGELLAIFFTHQRPGGPPFGIQPDEIRALFRDRFEILSLTEAIESVPTRQGEEHFGYFRCLNSERG